MFTFAMSAAVASAVIPAASGAITGVLSGLGAYFTVSAIHTSMARKRAKKIADDIAAEYPIEEEA